MPLCRGGRHPLKSFQNLRDGIVESSLPHFIKVKLQNEPPEDAALSCKYVGDKASKYLTKKLKTRQLFRIMDNSFIF